MLWIDNGFKVAKERSRRFPAQTITDVDNVDEIAILANTHVQAESLLYSLEGVAGGVDLHVNVDKTEYTCLIKEATSPHSWKKLRFILSVRSDFHMTDSLVKIFSKKLFQLHSNSKSEEV